MSKKEEAAPAATAPAAEAPKATETPVEAPKEAAPAATEAKTEAAPEAKTEVKEEAKAEPTTATEKKEEKVEKYDLKLPEGSTWDASKVEAVASLAKEKGWSNERAQQYIEDGHVHEARIAESNAAHLKTLNETSWKQEIEKDPEFGGAQFEKSGHHFYRAVETFAGKEFAEELKTMNLNHHPKLFKMMARVGRAIDGDKIVISGKPNNDTAGIPIERRLYPDMFKD